MPNSPHPQVGEYVRIAEWVGIITDVAVSQLDHVLLCIESPKQIVRGMEHGEWLEYMPEIMKQASSSDYACYTSRVAERKQRITAALREIAELRRP